MTARATLALTGLLALSALLAWPRATAQGPTQDLDLRLYLPLTALQAERASLPLPATARPPTVQPTEATPPSPEPTATEPPPSETPAPSATPTDAPTPTELPATGRIHGRYTVDGDPLSAGYGAEGLPQVELHRCRSVDCAAVARAVTADGGTFEFVNPPALLADEAYQVVWVNDPGLGYDAFLHRWWSRKVTALEIGAGQVVDLGRMEIGNLVLTTPCHDCLQTLPITFKWTARPSPSESYRWSLFRACGVYEQRPYAWQTPPLGHVSQYTVGSPPSGFRYDEKYCWFIHIDDGLRGIGWSYYDWRVTFCSSPATCR
jgi:hypothetical protein